MPAIWRIRERSTFQELRRRGRRVRRGPFSVTWIPGRADEPPQVGYAIGRAVGSAVVRNRIRRQLRVVLSDLADQLPAGAYLIGVSPAATSLTFDEMRTTVSTAIAAIASQPGTGPHSARRP